MDELEILLPPPESGFARVLRALGRAVLLTLAVSLILLAAALAYDRLVNRSAAPSAFGYSALVVATGSMSGTIEVGDLVIVYRSNDYAVGDIITFLPAGADVTTTHRIIRIEGGKYYTKGDANASEDTAPVSSEQIVGEVVAVVPGIGLFFEWLKTPEGLTFAGITVALVVAFAAVWRM